MATTPRLSVIEKEASPEITDVARSINIVAADTYRMLFAVFFRFCE